MSSFTLDSPRGPIAASRRGSGPPLVLICGVGSTRGLWGELPALLDRSFEVVTLDNRGVGGSRGGGPFTLDGAAADVLSVIDHLGHGEARLLGVSMGGLIALATALAAPDRVSRMVVMSAAAHLSAHGHATLGLLRHLLAHLPPDRFGQALMTLAFAPPFHSRHGAFVRETAELYGLDPGDVSGALLQLDHLLESWDLRPRLGSLSMPCLAIAGDRDPIVAWEDTAEIARCMPQAELLRVADAAHSILAEAGLPLLDRVTAFLSSA